MRVLCMQCYIIVVAWQTTSFNFAKSDTHPPGPRPQLVLHHTMFPLCKLFTSTNFRTLISVLVYGDANGIKMSASSIGNVSSFERNYTDTRSTVCGCLNKTNFRVKFPTLRRFKVSKMSVEQNLLTTKTNLKPEEFAGQRTAMQFETAKRHLKLLIDAVDKAREFELTFVQWQC